MKGGFPEKTHRGQICLLEPWSWPSPGKEIVVVLTLLNLIFIFAVKKRTNNFVIKLCHRRKMHCILKYRRNILTMNESIAFLVTWNLKSLFDNFWSKFYENNISPSRLFDVYNIYSFSFIIIYTFFFIVKINRSLQEMSQKGSKSGSAKFYAIFPSQIEPRRPDVNCVEPRTSFNHIYFPKTPKKHFPPSRQQTHRYLVHHENGLVAVQVNPGYHVQIS